MLLPKICFVQNGLCITKYELKDSTDEFIDNITKLDTQLLSNEVIPYCYELFHSHYNPVHAKILKEEIEKAVKIKFVLNEIAASEEISEKLNFIIEQVAEIEVQFGKLLLGDAAQ